ncbi:MAG: DegT/DnrJ/EryC1/StrS aminotransferase family protein [Alphaproteobacteria bacterium]|nr:DegT/DnrJ/EryC1/StrS aminotransferase family protein [Alphaproteobacteria bacterium]MBV9693217.1 DegT/DnrJ/EryC1/StrS aminotransferase family protein [Alphaproteobacteria bacterium]
MPEPIALIDLQAQRRRLGVALERAILDVVQGGQWVMGPQVAELERQLAKFVDIKHCIACANGTDALMIVLRAWGVGPGDAVFVPAFTFAASAEVVALVGATPVFVDVLEDTYNMDPASLEAAIAMVKRDGKLKPKVVMPVDLFGQAADYRVLEPLIAREGLKLLCDAAQGFGALIDGRRAGGIGDAAATSFFPAKPLGCYGDGGATFTNDDALAEALRSIRIHGQGRDKYENVRIGVNSRLDTIQAAVLLEKLKIFEDEIELRQTVANRYNEAFRASNRIVEPKVIDGAVSTWAQYTIQVPDRDKVQAALKAKGIPSAIYYPIPLSLQGGYRNYPSAPTPVSERISKTVLSLPMHPYLDAATQSRIIEAVLEAV